MTDISNWRALIHKQTTSEKDFSGSSEFIMIPVNEYQIGNLLGLLKRSKEHYNGDWFFEIISVLVTALHDMGINYPPYIYNNFGDIWTIEDLCNDNFWEDKKKEFEADIDTPKTIEELANDRREFLDKHLKEQSNEKSKYIIRSKEVDVFHWTSREEEYPEWICEAIKFGDILIEQKGHLGMRLSLGAGECVFLGDYIILDRDTGKITKCREDFFKLCYEPFKSNGVLNE